ERRARARRRTQVRRTLRRAARRARRARAAAASARMSAAARPGGTPAFRAVIFDMDGVVTRTARLHAAAWKELFDQYLEERTRRGLPAFRPFDPQADYL